MDRKARVNASATGNASGDGLNSKEAALEKLRKMEWKRNSQDAWHLARTNSRGNDVQERKKYDKDEDIYFEGTGAQKTKKLRRPRTSDGTPSVPPGFSMSQASPGAPQVNAWAQKKGSALFQKEDEIDEDDQVLKLVLKESIKSAEEDKKRRMERLKMTNLDVPISQSKHGEKDWEEEYKKEEFHTEPSPVGYQEDSPKPDLHFVETDLKEETTTVNQRHRSILPRARKISPREKPCINKNLDYPESEKKVESLPKNKNIHCNNGIEGSSRVIDNEHDYDDFFEPSRPQVKYSKPIVISSNSTTMTNRSSVKHVDVNSDDLSTNFHSALTFGDTQGLFEKIHEDSGWNQTNDAQNLKPSSHLKTSNSDQIKPTNPCEPSETDILLHSFIRHEPPSDINSMVQSSVSNISGIKQHETNDLFALPISHPYSPQDVNSARCYTSVHTGDAEQHPMVNGLVSGGLSAGIQMPNGRDSCSSLSGSPLQTITPYGSIEKEVTSNVAAAVPSQIGNVAYPYPYNIENNAENMNRHLQAMQLMNQNHSVVMNRDYSSIPAPIRGIMPGNAPGAQPQYCLPNANVMMQSYQGQHMSPLLLQQQIQQAQLRQVQVPPGYSPHMLPFNAEQPPQSHLAAGITKSDENIVKVQEHIIQPQAQNDLQLLTENQVLTQNQQQMLQLQQNHPQMLQLQQNHPQMLQLQQNHSQMLHLQQNHAQLLSMQNQAQAMPSVETVTPKQEELLQQNMSQGDRGQLSGKTPEELQIEYQNAIQAVMRLQEKINEAERLRHMPQAQVQPAWGVMQPNSTVPVGVNQFFPVSPIMHQVHPHLIQQPHNTSLISPTIQHTPQNLSGTMNMSPEINLGSEMNTAQELAQMSTETKVGRGRGRIH